MFPTWEMPIFAFQFLQFLGMTKKAKQKYDPKLSVKENAERMGIAASTIYFRLKKNNIYRKKDKQQALIAEISEAIKAYPVASQKTIATITNHGVATINKYWRVAKDYEASRKSTRKSKKAVSTADLKEQIDALIQMEHCNTQRLAENPKFYPTPRKSDLFKTELELYDAAHYVCVAFRRKDDLWKDMKIPFGNMNGGFSFEMNGVNFRTSEHAYISGIFSNDTLKHKDLQERLLKIGSGYMAKRDIRAKNKSQCRKDWDEFNIDWMLYCVWNKVKYNEKFRNLLMAIPRNAMIIEDVSFQGKPKLGKDTSTVWGCRNQEKKRFGDLVRKYAKSITFKNKAARKRFVNQYLWDYCNNGEYVGQNIMGKILTLIKNCLHEGTEPDIDYALLNSKNIYLLGNKLDFNSLKK